MQRQIQQVFTSLKERTYVNYAKIVTIGGFCDINLIIIKATSPDDLPLPDKYVYEFLKIFSISSTSHQAFALSFTRRFGRTRSWRVALKCLVLLHRLLRALPDDGPFRAELLWAQTSGFLSLYPCNFQDSTSSNSEDYTAFIRSYARLLDEALACTSTELLQEQEIQASLEHHDDQENNSPPKMEDLGRMLEILPQLQSQIDRLIDCWPAGVASRSFLVQLAMKHIIRDSFSCYTLFRREIAMVLDNLIRLPYRGCAAAFGIYKKAALQAKQLSEFHQWCKNMGYCGPYEYPFIDRIPEIQIRALETFLNGMWQLTDQSSSSSNMSTQTSLSNVQSPTTDDDDGYQRAKRDAGLDREMEPLIKWEVDDNNVGWEYLLEASTSTKSYMASRNDQWQMQVYNPYATPNPFDLQQPHRTSFFHGSCPNTPMHCPRGL